MNIEYFPIGATDSVVEKVSLLNLATNVITDWIPDVPNTMANGFAELLGNILVAEKFGTNRWYIDEIVKGFEKQWKSSTSWMLGVAFSRYVFQKYKYSFWAPVSAFTSAANINSVARPSWHSYLNASDCLIEKKAGVDSNLLPDYVLAKGIKGNWELSFAESKGNKMNLDGSKSPPSAWINQSRNAEFFYRGQTLPTAQNLLIVTRVNPNAKRKTTRLAKVRVWNAADPDTSIPFDALRSILVMHYFGACKRIGLDSNADLLVVSNYLREIDNKIERLENNSDDNSETNHSYQRKRDSELRRLTKHKEEAESEINRTEDQVRQETEFIRAKVSDKYILQNSARSTFSLGNNRAIRIGLTEDAVRIINWLQGQGNFNISPENFLDFVNFDNSQSLQGDDREISFAIRSDGVYSERF